MKSQGSDAMSEGRTRSPKVEGRIPKACARSKRADTKGTRTQLGNEVPEVDTKSKEVGHIVPRVGCKVRRSDTKSEGRGLNPEGVCKEPRAGHEGDWDSTGRVRDWRGLPGMGQGLTMGCRALSERGPKAQDGSQGPRGISVQQFAGRVQVYGSQ